MRYRFLLIFATIVWGSSFVIVKDTTDFISPAWLLAMRFALATVLMAAVFYKKRDLFLDKGHVWRGLLLGVVLFSAYYAQTIGITDTTPGKNAFLTAPYCVMVPFFAWMARQRKLVGIDVAAAIACVVGVGLVSLDGDLSIRFGDAMTLVGAVMYAVHIVQVDRFAPGHDIYVLTMWQFAGVTACSLVAGIAFEPMPILSQISVASWASVAYLGVMCTMVCLLLQNIGQKHLPPAQASLLLSLESVFGVAFSVALGQEDLTMRIMLGFVTIFGAILLSELWPRKTEEHS